MLSVSMPEPLPETRARTPVLLALAVMTLACALIAAALVLVVQGAVAMDGIPRVA
jgi:hypothetical protein